MLEKQIWETRYKALDKGICNTIESLEDNPPLVQGKVNGENIKVALKLLKKWSNRQFDFFLNGFESGSLVETPKHVAEFALRRTLDQMAYDLLILRRAYHQRLEPKATANERITLDLADKVAYQSLKPAICANLIDKRTTVITYFQKEPNVRVIPYGSLALIGIPYTCTYNNDSGAITENNAQDFLAIPHEIGHYIFWHGRKKFKNSTVCRSLRTQILSKLTPYSSSWTTSWLEEIFADIYSTLIAGPVSVLSLQNMLFDNLHMDEDDGHHPVPRLRPVTHFRVLHEHMQATKVGQTNPKSLFPNATKQLKENWRSLIKMRGLENSELVKINTNEPDSYILYSVAREQIERITDDMLSILDTDLPKIIDKTWGQDIDSSLGELYKHFQDQIVANSLYQPPILKISPGESRLVDTLPDNNLCADFEESSNEDSCTENHLEQWFVLLENASKQGLSLSPAIWETLIVDNGWAVGGPEDDAGSK